MTKHLLCLKVYLMGYAPASPQHFESEAAGRNRKTPQGPRGKSDIAEKQIMRNTSNNPNKTGVDFRREIWETKQTHRKQLEKHTEQI